MAEYTVLREQADGQSMASSDYLLALSAELRNLIYEFVFTPDRVFNKVYLDKTELLKSNPPFKALLQVNRQIYQGARSIYRDAYRSYWTDSQFCLTSADWAGIEDAKDDDLNHVEHLLIRVDGHSLPVQAFNSRKSFWTFEMLEPERKVSSAKLRRLGWKESKFSSDVLERTFYGAFGKGHHEKLRQLCYLHQEYQMLHEVSRWAEPVREPMKRQIMAILRHFRPEYQATVHEWCLWLEDKHVEGCVCYDDQEDAAMTAEPQADGEASGIAV